MGAAASKPDNDYAQASGLLLARIRKRARCSKAYALEIAAEMATFEWPKDEANDIDIARIVLSMADEMILHVPTLDLPDASAAVIPLRRVTIPHEPRA